jgi:hypothetical protein
MQPGEVARTQADASREHDIGFKPSVPLEEGVRRFVAWYRAFRGICDTVKVPAGDSIPPAPRSDRLQWERFNQIQRAN